MRITEYVGKEGVRSTAYDHHRSMFPKPGDFIRWPNGKTGRVDATFDPNEPKAYLDKPGDILCCCELGSAFLGWNEAKQRPYVSISGGPFITINTRDLAENGLHVGRFWNWGDNLPGADMGVEYNLARPAFRYIGTSTHYSITKKED